MDIAAMAKAVLPKESKIAKLLDQAQEMSSKYNASPQGIDKLLSDFGKQRKDILPAMEALNSERIAKTMDRWSPGLRSKLNQAGEALLNTEEIQQPKSAKASTLDELRARLSKL